MSRIEEELRSALRRENPSGDFTDRVMARIASLPAEPQPLRQKWRLEWWRRIAEFLSPIEMKWAIAGAMAILLIFGALGLHRYREHQRMMAEIAEGERAKEQVMLAMKIASAKLNLAQRKIQR